MTYWIAYTVFAIVITFVANWILRPAHQTGWQRNKIGLFLGIMFLLFALSMILTIFLIGKFPELEKHKMLVFMILGFIVAGFLEFISRKWTAKKVIK